jgi:hypothetical protein
MNQPLVTVNILSFNRKDDLRITLQKVFEQDYKNIEVIVVDNHSTDGTVEMVKNDYPAVHVIELTQNIGIAGWNEGFKAAQGEYVLVLDDDSYPELNSIHSAVMSIQSKEDVGIVAFNIINGISNLSETEGHYFKEKNLTFIGCGALLKKSVFDKVGRFNSDLFVYVHEREYCVRMIDQGFHILYDSNAIVIHKYSIKNRNIPIKSRFSSRQQYYDIRNNLYILYKYFPLYIFFDRMIRIVVSKLIFGVLHGLFWTTLKGFISFIILAFKTSRTPVGNNTVQLYQNGKYIAGFFSNGKYSLSLKR